MKILKEDEILDTPIPDVVADIELSEDDIEPTFPANGVDNGISTMLIDAIRNTWDLIINYNSIISTLTEFERDDIISIVGDIVNQENENVGKLQKALEIVSPNTAIIDDGATQVELEREENEDY